MVADTGAGKTGLNVVFGFRGFLAKWRDLPSETLADVGVLPRSSVGNINDAASPHCDHAQIFGPADPLFLQSIEPRVRPLVLAIVGQCGWITYSSCEGHPSVGQTPARRRNVGIVPRDDAEQSEIMAILGPAISAANRSVGDLAVSLKLVERTLQTEDGPQVCLDLVFAPQDLPWDRYEREADGLQSRLLDALSAHATLGRRR